MSSQKERPNSASKSTESQKFRKTSESTKVSSSRSFSIKTKPPLVESHNPKSTSSTTHSKKDFLGLPIVKKEGKKPITATPNEKPVYITEIRAVKDEAECSRSGTSETDNKFVKSEGQQKLSLFEALELADNLERNIPNDIESESLSSVTTISQLDSSKKSLVRSQSNNSSLNQFQKNSPAVVPKLTKEISGSTSKLTKELITPREQALKSDSLKRKNSNARLPMKTDKLDLKQSDLNYHRYLRAKFLGLSLENAHKKRQESAFVQLYSMTAENCRVQNEITDLRISADQTEFNRKMNICIEKLNECLSGFIVILKQFLPVFVNFALAVDSTRHRFYLHDIKLPLSYDFKVSIDYCNEFSEILSTQVDIIHEILNSQNGKSEKIEDFCEIIEKFLEYSEQIERNVNRCKSKCENFFSLINKMAAKDTPGILNSVNAVDNLDVSVFNF